MRSGERRAIRSPAPVNPANWPLGAGYGRGQFDLSMPSTPALDFASQPQAAAPDRATRRTLASCRSCGRSHLLVPRHLEANKCLDDRHVEFFAARERDTLAACRRDAGGKCSALDLRKSLDRWSSPVPRPEPSIAASPTPSPFQTPSRSMPAPSATMPYFAPRFVRLG